MKRSMQRTAECASPNGYSQRSSDYGGGEQAVAVATIPPPPQMQLSPIAHIVKGGLAVHGAATISTAAAVAALGSNAPTCLGKKALKDLTTAESILLLDLVCHPNRIPLGSIKYRITGENLCHVKTGQDLQEIGLNFPRIILCSMADAIVKYQSEGVPLEIFPSTCSLSAKTALHDFTLSMGSPAAGASSASSNENAVEDGVPSPEDQEKMWSATAPAFDTLCKATSAVSPPFLSTPPATTTATSAANGEEEENEDEERGGRQKRVARAKKSDTHTLTHTSTHPHSPVKTAPETSHIPTHASVPSTATAENTRAHTPCKKREKNSTAEASPTAKKHNNNANTNADTDTGTERHIKSKNMVFLSRDPSPMDLEVVAAIEQKLHRDGYAIVTRFPASSVACSAASNGNNNSARKSIGNINSDDDLNTGDGENNALVVVSADKKDKEKEKAKERPSLVRCLAEIPELEALSAFEFMRELLMLPARQKVLTDAQAQAQTTALVTANAPPVVCAPPAREYLSENIVNVMVSIAKVVLESCPLLPGARPRPEDIDAIYDLLSAALSLDLPGIHKAEIVYDQIVDIATSHHRSFRTWPADNHAQTSSTTLSSSSSLCEGEEAKKSDGEDSQSLALTHTPTHSQSLTQSETQTNAVEEQRQLIGTPRICDILIQMLKEHYAKVDVCVITCCAINDVTMQRSGFFRAYQDKFHESGTAEVLIRALFLHKTNGTAIQSICCAIIGLIANNLHNSLYFRELGTFEVLVQVLRLHLIDKHVVERILDAMFRVALFPKPQRRERDGERDGSSESESDALAHAASSPTLYIKPIRFKETGACELIVEVLSLHKINPSIASTAARIIDLMSVNADHAVKLGQVGAIEELLEVLKLYISRESIEKHAANALRNLLECEENKVKVNKIGACELILKILLLHLNAVLVADTLCSVVLCLASNRQNAIKLGESGACLILVELLKEHHANASIVKQACGALRFIAVSAENQRRLVDHDLFSVLVSVLGTHAHDALIVGRVCDALDNIAIIPKKNLTEAVAADGSTKMVPDRPELFVPFVPPRYAHVIAHATQHLPQDSVHRHVCHAMSMKRNQSLLPFTEVPPHKADAVRKSKILQYLQECLTIHANNRRLTKKVRETLLLMSCLC